MESFNRQELAQNQSLEDFCVSTGRKNPPGSMIPESGCRLLEKDDARTRR
jgi:hypothetical protein